MFSWNCYFLGWTTISEWRLCEIYQQPHSLCVLFLPHSCLVPWCWMITWIGVLLDWILFSYYREQAMGTWPPTQLSKGSRAWKHNVRWCWETGLVLGKPWLTDKTMTSSSEAFSNFFRKEEQRHLEQCYQLSITKEKAFLAETQWVYRTHCQGGRNTALLPPSLLHYFLLSTKHL